MVLWDCLLGGARLDVLRVLLPLNNPLLFKSLTMYSSDAYFFVIAIGSGSGNGASTLSLGLLGC